MATKQKITLLCPDGFRDLVNCTILSTSPSPPHVSKISFIHGILILVFYLLILPLVVMLGFKKQMHLRFSNLLTVLFCLLRIGFGAASIFAYFAFLRGRPCRYKVSEGLGALYFLARPFLPGAWIALLGRVRRFEGEKVLKHYNAVPAFVLAGVLALTFADIPLLIPMFQARVNPALDPAAQGKREKDARLHSLRHAETVNMVAFGLSTFALLILMGLIAHIYKFTRNLEADSVVVLKGVIFATTFLIPKVIYDAVWVFNVGELENLGGPRHVDHLALLLEALIVIAWVSMLSVVRSGGSALMDLEESHAPNNEPEESRADGIAANAASILMRSRRSLSMSDNFSRGSMAPATFPTIDEVPKRMSAYAIKNNDGANSSRVDGEQLSRLQSDNISPITETPIPSWMPSPTIPAIREIKGARRHSLAGSAFLESLRSRNQSLAGSIRDARRSRTESHEEDGVTTQTGSLQTKSAEASAG